ncbi:MAG: polyketide cyclase [Gemmatimonadaceae bacterium]|nr:polyketide cyclase [Gemmatimonadaceae bacterium]
MSSRQQYTPGAASGADVRKEGDKWTLVLVRTLAHPPAKVWKALTEPEHLREWAPFDADRNLGTVGTATLTTVGAPTPQVAETLWHNIDRRFIAMGAAGLHICLDVLARALDGQPIGRMVGMEVMKFDGWQRLHAEYAKQFHVESDAPASGRSK